MKDIKVKIVENSKVLKYFFPEWVAGVAIGHTVHIKGTIKEGRKYLLNHELIHVAQYEKGGFFKTLFTYTICEMFVSYKNKVIEVEAYTNEENLDYITDTYGYNMVIGG